MEMEGAMKSNEFWKLGVLYPLRMEANELRVDDVM